MSDAIEIIDVSPRDGLQNESTLLATETKLELIARLVDAGVRRLEATSFVHPKLVPAMADAETVMEGVERRDDVSYIGLVLNERGLERAIASDCDEVNYAVVVSDTFSRENQGTSTDEGIAVWHSIARKARASGIPASLVVSAAFGCPFEGEVRPRRLAEVVERCLAEPPNRLSLADTIGVASPADVVERFSAIMPSVPGDVQIGAHFHNTRGTGLANVAAAVGLGIRSFDASLGGLGGCPFAPNATGNISTEDAVYMLHRMGFTTGLDLDALADTADWVEQFLPGSVVGLYHRAGPFPRT